MNLAHVRWWTHDFLGTWTEQLKGMSWFKWQAYHLPPEFSLVTQSCPTLQPHGLQHTRLPCLSATPRACSNSGPSSQWWHPTTSSFVIRFSSCLQSFHHQGLFQWVSSSHQVAKVLELLWLCLRSCKVLSCVIRRHKVSLEVSESQNPRSSKST